MHNLDKVVFTINISFWAVLFYFSAAGFVITAYLTWRFHRHAKLQAAVAEAAAKKAIKPYEKTYSGWVYVNEAALKPASNRPISRVTLHEIELRWPVHSMLQILDPWKRAELVKLVHSGKDWIEYEDRQRGFTIGSALFNYPIPESLVLIDSMTQLLYARYRMDVEDRRTYVEWHEHDPALMNAQHLCISDVEKTMKISRSELMAFYNDRIEMITRQMLLAIGKENIPTPEGMVDTIGRIMSKHPLSDVAQHLVRLCMTVVIRQMEIKVPVQWVMTSTLADYLYNISNGVEEPATGLSLVVDNDPNSLKDKNVW